jgi:hypothetical protein
MRGAIFGVAIVLACRPTPDAPPPPPASGTRVADPVASFVRFEENRGQAGAAVDFVARASSHAVFLSGGDAIFSLAASRPAGASADAAPVRLSFVGAHDRTLPLGEAELPSRSHYLIGRDPGRWHTNVRHYERVRYPGLYPGIDLVYHGGHRLEFDLVVRPGADPSTIAFRLTGAGSVRTDSAGRLVAEHAAGRIVLPVPEVYQENAGVRRPVAGGFRLVGAGEVRFDLGEYDRSRQLVIDPLVIVYSSYVGGSGSEAATDIAVDRQGMAYVTGQTFSADFPVQNAAQGAQASGEDAYVLKVNPAASGAASLIYATYLGSTERDGAEAIAVDTSGRALVTGWTHAGDFPVTADGFKATWTPTTSPNDDESDAFAVILNAAGDGLVYGTYFGGDRDDEGMGIVPRGDSVFYLAGGTDGGTFPTTASAFDQTGQVRSAFVSVLDWRTNTLRYSTVYHAATDVQLQTRGLAVDASLRAHVTGLARGDGLPVVNAFMATFPPDASSSFGRLGSFLAVFDPAASGSASLVYATYLGAGDAEDVAVDSEGRSIVVGTTSSPTFPTTPGAFDTVCEGLLTPDGSTDLGCQKDAFVMRIDPDLSGSASLVHASRLGGPRSEEGFAVALDPSDNVFVTGSTSSAAFPAVEALTDVAGRPDGETDAFLTKMSPTINSLLFSTRLGGVTRSNGSTGASDVGRAVALAPDGGACIAGTTSARDFPIVRGFDTALGGSGDAFVAKLTRPTPRPCPEAVIPVAPGIPFVWEPPLEICILWDGGRGSPGTLPERCPPPECPECGPGLSRTGPAGRAAILPAPLSRVYREAAGVLAGGGARGRPIAARPGSGHPGLLRALRGAPTGAYFSESMKAELARALERPDRTARGQILLRRSLTAGLNAMELDWRLAGGPAPRATLAPSRPVDLGGLGTVRLPGGEGEVSLEVRSGLPATPRGVRTGWPLATYRVATSSKLPPGTRAEVELYVGWIGFTGGGETRLMAWNGKEYRDATSGYDVRRGLVRGFIGLDELGIVVRTPLCYPRFVPITRTIRRAAAAPDSD